jgi:hypothetical protein
MKSRSVFVSIAMAAISLVGISLANPASASSDSDSRQVVAVCGPNGSVQVVDADKVPVGCHVSTINTPPAGHG